MKKQSTPNKLKEIMLEAGYEFAETNRSYFCKAVNEALTGGFVTIEVAKKGLFFTNKETGKQCNLKVHAGGWTARRKGDVTSSGILRAIGELLQEPAVKEKILSYVSLHPHCGRCNGVGIIPQFHYYCNGICFECYGTGYSKYRDVVEVIKPVKV